MSGTHNNIVEMAHIQTNGAGNGETLLVHNNKAHKVGVTYYNPVASRTGVIIEKGDENGQMIRVVNTATTAVTITFAVAGTSNVAGGTSIVIGQNEALEFIWSVTLSLWIPTCTLQGLIQTADIANAAVTGAKLSTGVGYFIVAKDSNGTTPVNVIAATVPFAGTITGFYVISKDTTAGTITLADTTGTVGTVAKGATSGALVGCISLTNTTVNSGDTLTIVSSSAGNVTAFVTFTVA